MAYASGRPVGSFLAGILLSGQPLWMCAVMVGCSVASLAFTCHVGQRLQAAEDAAMCQSLQEESSSV
eukprot:CAMPEP_0197702404 /NCGR_PEP_ID=MMETSP1338-20131121/124481_1 /TAXON_ID=43686 ORGANISM="Pelagodinium beii, Strain RCC1491" /NCGR_SAMPLE_ID=MMETSP1338 /ASSEMBLY_ACC=CAM_ASM_000754 /LENGTH=66 /DNA_ID=CAMNT_0043286235 /DNA_START=15 /DNA_END=212 /DNA_ORIENTATION=-